MKKKGLKLISLLMAVLMLTFCVSAGMSAFAAEETTSADADETVSEEVQPTDEVADIEENDETQPETEAQTKAAPKKAKAQTGAAGDTVYCQNAAGWSDVYCYMWTDGQGDNSAWPGVKMTNLGDGVFEYKLPKDFKMIIFNNNAGTQTGNMEYPGNSQIYNNSTQKWEPYSTSPVKITSFTSSVESPAYLGTSALLSAVATSSAGTLTYKFSANGAVIYQGAQSSCAWIPTQVGTYKLTVDVSDTAGNTNSRSLSIEVKDASALEAPFISAFSNSLKTNTQIKHNSAVTFTLGALGGKVGTNLLFYKFEVTDPDGKPNTAYYTTKNTYQITPTKLGKYTVVAYVQNSYNDTVQKTYTYTSVDNITETPNASTPTQPDTSSVTPTSTAAPQPGGLLGDVNNDGTISVKDATAIQMKIALMPVAVFNESVADVNRDGSVNVKDATQIQKLVAKLIDSF